MIDVPPWAATICVLAGFLILGLTLWPDRRQRRFDVPDEEPTWVVCRRNCRDQTCMRFGCPSDPDWKGDMR